MKNLIFIVLLLMGTTIIAQTSSKHLLVGTKAPVIKASDQNGNKLNSTSILQNEQLIVVFYRGQWCPYCNKHLAELEENVSKFKEAGARLIVITPENNENIEKTIKKTDASYSILWDKDNSLMKSFGVDFVLAPELQKKYKGFGVDLPSASGNNSQILPVPATYIIGKNGLIKYVQYDPNYKNRSSARDILDNL